MNCLPDSNKSKLHLDFTILAFCHPYCLESKCNMHLSEIWHSKKNDSRLSRTQVSSYLITT